MRVDDGEAISYRRPYSELPICEGQRTAMLDLCSLMFFAVVGLLHRVRDAGFTPSAEAARGSGGIEAAFRRIFGEDGRLPRLRRGGREREAFECLRLFVCACVWTENLVL